MTKPIIKLPECTIRLIAAGEVVTRPVNVVKELLENSLDAGATNVRINIEQGGMKTIEIIDNGHGIALSDAELLCHRFATSKLSKAIDLENIRTFGFRGEALASITEVADLEVRTFNKAFDECGWHAKYKASQLIEPPNKKYVPQGTHLIVKNLFHNLSRRREAVQATFVEEKKAIVDLVTRYSIHHREKVTFILSDGRPTDLICLLAPIELRPAIGSFFGLEFENNLISTSANQTGCYEAKVDIAFSYKQLSGSHQTSPFILFVNDRLVDCDCMKKELEGLINQYLSTKQIALLMYIDLKVPPNDVDVNTHPSKATVTLLNQVEIIALIGSHVREKLASKFTQKIIPKFSSPSLSTRIYNPNSPTSHLSQDVKIKVRSDMSSTSAHLITPRPYELVHNDSTQLSLDQTWTAKEEQKSSQIPEIIEPKRKRRDIKLLSLMLLREKIVDDQAVELAKMIKHSVFIGTFDHKHALIQYDTGLFSINLKEYLTDLIYQFYIYDFGNFPPINILPPGNNIKHLIKITLDDYEKNEPKYFMSLEFKTVDDIMNKLHQHAPMYQDYLNITFTDDQILTIPNLIPGEVPTLVFLGRFLINLANKVDYREEYSSIRSMGMILADFYSEPPANLRDPQVYNQYQKTIEEKLWLAIKNYQFISKRLLKPKYTSKISDTKLLYKVFERC